MPRILLTTVTRPLGGPDQGPSMGADVMRGQLCVNQGAFRTSGVGWAYGLEYIAANIASPAVVLHWPSRRELIRELKHARYDYVGVSYTFQLIPRMIETVRLIRRHSPGSRIILGGYGTAAVSTAVHGDLFCDSDGIGFMRELLNERQTDPISHPTIVYGNHLLSLPVRAGRKVVVCTGLGCTVGCDFCASSQKFRRRYLPFVADGDELFRVMTDLCGRTGINEFQVLDENFLVHRERAMRLADLCQERGQHFEFFTFASVKSLREYSADELCRIGVSALWIGLEGKHAGYDKLHGEGLKQLIARLKHHGILVCGSMIIGFDYQNPDTIRSELSEILAAEPTYLQCLVYGPAPGTPLYRRLDAERRWIDGGPGKGIPYGKCDGFALSFEHPCIGPDEMSRLQGECYDRDLHQGGFSVYRAIETWLEGYSNLRHRSEGYLRARANVYERKLRASRPLLGVGIHHAPNPQVRERMIALRDRLRREFGPVRAQERALESLVLPAAALWTRFKLHHGLFSEPTLIRRSYRC